jgi:hypothetical protein
MKKVDEPNYELELLEDEEIKNFKDMVKKMEELKIEINENLTKGNN